MKFEAMLSFWTLKGMIKHSSCQTNDKMHDPDINHITYLMTVVSGSLHANIFYRFEQKHGVKSKFALMYADVLFNGFPSATGRGSAVFIKNAKCTDLNRHLIEDVMKMREACMGAI